MMTDMEAEKRPTAMQCLDAALFYKVPEEKVAVIPGEIPDLPA